MSNTTIGLGPFLEALEQRLNEHSASQLCEILLDHATWLPAGDRLGFLALFDPAPHTPDRSASGSAGAGDTALLAEVESFVEAIDEGFYVESFGYDPEYRDHRAFGDESWTDALDHLLQRAGRSLLAGDAATARTAYRQLFDAMQAEHEGGGFPGAGTPEDLISTDVDEAKHRYLRAVWESEPPEARAAAVLAAVEDTEHLGGTPSLAALEATRRQPLPDLDATLPDLLVRLAAVPAGYGFGTQARRLLVEATERSGGLDGLGELARTPSDQQADAYRDWVDALVRAHRLDDARQAAGEALDRLQPAGRTIAAIAERAGLLAAASSDDAAVLAAGQTAWRADPTRERLLALVEAATTVGALDEVLSGEAERIEAGWTDDAPIVRRPDMAAGLLLLTGRVEDAIRLADNTEDLGWDGGCSPAPAVVPFLLLAASDASRDDRWNDSLLFQLLDEANTTGWRFDSVPPDGGLDLLRTALADQKRQGEARRGTAPGRHLLLSALLTDRFEHHLPTAPERHRWLETGRRLIDGSINEVVGGQRRAAYARVAHFAAACAEAIQLANGARDASSYLDDLHARYPRHTLFRRELRSIAAESPILR